MSAPPRDASLTSAALSECILAVARSRDLTAFTSLFLHFAPRLKAYFLRLGANQGLAEDLAQETLLVVWRKAALFDPGKAGAVTWIYTIARNLRLNAARQERLVNGNDIEPPFPPEDKSPGTEEAFISLEQEDRLRQALHALHPDLTRLLLLWGFEDKSHRQIERELGIPIGTVKSRLRRALALLRASLEGCRGN